MDLDDTFGETTIFTITNVTNVDRIARVTLWTDYAFPVVTFNLFLTGYAVQSINLYSVIGRGAITPEPSGTAAVRRGPYSEQNPALDGSECAELPGKLPAEIVAVMRSAFLEGIAPTTGGLQACRNVGNVHDNAVGYTTIDLVRNCSSNNPFAEEYWTEDLAYDNVLIGDYQQVDAVNRYAQGSPLVHIRAIPEGGTPAERLEYQRTHEADFPRTFYGHYQPAHAPKLDSRQPLPSVFAARVISGGPSGSETGLKTWREGKIGRGVTCATYDDSNVTKIAEIVRFDEAENAVGDVPVSRITPITEEFTLPASSLTNVKNASIVPQLINGAVGGWVYLNLDNSKYDVGGSSNWVIFSMRAEGRFSVDIDAAALGNGCSPPAAETEVTIGTTIIGPLPNENP